MYILHEKMLRVWVLINFSHGYTIQPAIFHWKIFLRPKINKNHKNKQTEKPGEGN